MVSARYRTIRTGFLVGALVGGCGGDAPLNNPTTPTTPVNPTPPVTPVATSLAISSGDGQEAAASATLALVPSVVVRDQLSRPMRGVTVQFSPTGGGRVDSATATTDSTGIARAGRWTLGADSTQQLRAQSGSLTPVTLSATITPGTAVVTTPIVSGGGVVVINTPLHPYRGLKLTIPPRTGGAATDVRWRVLPNAPMPVLPVGVRVRGPLLEVSTELERTASPMTLELPLRAPPGEGVAVLHIDPIRQVTELMPITGRTDSTVRITTTHLRADLLIGAPPPTAARSLRTSISLGHLLPVSFFLDSLRAVPPVVNVPVFRWPVLDHGTAQFPSGLGLAIHSLQTLRLATTGSPFAHRAFQLATPGFYADTATFALAIRAQSQLASRVGALLSEAREGLATMPSPSRERNILGGIGLALSLSRLPSVLAVLPASSSAEPAFVSAVSYAAGGQVQTLNQAAAAIGSIGLTLSGLAPLSIATTADGTPFAAQSVVPLTSHLLPFESIQQEMQTLGRALQLIGAALKPLNDSLASQVSLPAGHFDLKALFSDGFHSASDTLVLRNKNVFGEIRASFGAVAQWFSASTRGVETGRTATGLLPLTRLPDIATAPIGAIVQGFGAVFTNVNGQPRQRLPISFWFVKAPFDVAPDTTIMPGDRRVTLTATIPFPPAVGYRIEWKWGDGTPNTENVSQNSATHVYAQNGDYTVVATLRDRTTRAEMAVDTVHVVNTVVQWRITAFTPDFLPEYIPELLDDPAFAPLHRLITVPQAGLIVLGGDSTAAELNLFTRPNGTWAGVECCPVNTTGATRLPLGRRPAELFAFGPYFAQWNISFQESTLNRAAGTMEGRFLQGTRVFPVPNGGAQLGPEVVWHFSNVLRTRSGFFARLTVRRYFVDTVEGSGDVEESGYSFDVAAELLRPHQN